MFIDEIKLTDINEARKAYTDAVYKHLQDSGELDEIMSAIKKAIEDMNMHVVLHLTDEQVHILKKFGYTVYPCADNGNLVVRNIDRFANQLNHRHSSKNKEKHCISGWANDN